MFSTRAAMDPLAKSPSFLLHTIVELKVIQVVDGEQFHFKVTAVFPGRRKVFCHIAQGVGIATGLKGIANATGKEGS